MKNFFVLIIFFYFLTLLQVSFLVPIFQGIVWILNFNLILVILIVLFKKIENFPLFFTVFLGGFFLDIFSERFFGFWILILLGISFFIKYFLKKYIRLSFFL